MFAKNGSRGHMDELYADIEKTRPRVGISRKSEEYKDWARKVNELGRLQKKHFGVSLVNELL